MISPHTKWDWLVVGTVLLNITDAVMTLPHWSQETNPLLIAIGPQWMLAAKISASVGLCAVWFRWDGVSSSIVSKASVGVLAALYLTVVGANATAIV